MKAKLTKTQTVRLSIAKHLFFWLMDGTGMGAAGDKAVWNRIDRELKAARLTRDDLGGEKEE